MAGFKSQRMSEDIKRIVSAKLTELKDPRLQGGEGLTLVRCEVAGDGSFARLYISSFYGIDRAREAVKGLESAAGFLRREISNVLHLKKCPELKFIADDSIEHSAYINRLLKDVLPDEGDALQDGDGDEDINAKEE